MKNVLIFAAALWQSGDSDGVNVSFFLLNVMLCLGLSERPCVCVCAQLIFSSCKVPKCETGPTLIPSTILALNHPFVPVFLLLLPPPPASIL